MNEQKSPATEQIEQRAYELYLERGGEEGHALEDWLAAEKDLAQSQSISAAPKTRAAVAGFQSKSQKAGKVSEETPVEIAND